MKAHGSTSESTIKEHARDGTHMRAQLLRLPRHLRFQVDKVLRLPGTPRCIVQPEPACYACHEICASRFTTSAPVHKARRLPQICASIFKAPSSATARQDHFQKRSFRSRHSPISENEPRVQRSRLTAPATKSERTEDHCPVQSTAPATKSALKSAHQSPTAPISCICHEALTLDQHEVSLTKSDRQIRTFENAHVATMRALLLRPSRFCKPRSRNALQDLRIMNHECIYTLNSSELAMYAE